MWGKVKAARPINVTLIIEWSREILKFKYVKIKKPKTQVKSVKNKNMFLIFLLDKLFLNDGNILLMWLKLWMKQK